MPKARITEIKDALADLIDSKWTAHWPDRGNDDAVDASSLSTIDSKENGRKILVYVGPYSGSAVTRGQDRTAYTLLVYVAERYPDTGDIPEGWVEDRLYFTEWLNQEIGDPRTVRLLDAVWPDEVNVTTTVDYDDLHERKLFVSVITATYVEHR